MIFENGVPFEFSQVGKMNAAIALTLSIYRGWPKNDIGESECFHALLAQTENQSVRMERNGMESEHFSGIKFRPWMYCIVYLRIKRRLNVPLVRNHDPRTRFASYRLFFCCVHIVEQASFVVLQLISQLDSLCQVACLLLFSLLFTWTRSSAISNQEEYFIQG